MGVSELDVTDSTVLSHKIIIFSERKIKENLGTDYRKNMEILKNIASTKEGDDKYRL